jgi:glycosyltransferase involved in cell wall biosynthesis
MVLVSAVIPTRGRPDMVLRAARSALSQTLREMEVVVVLDGKDSATESVLEKLAKTDVRFRFIVLGASVGGSDARNRGVECARGQWVAFLDDDDEWLPGKLEAQYELVKASKQPS